MYPHERSLVEKFKDRPFVILGVNSDDDRAQLKEVLVTEKITWPSFWDGGSTQGPIATKWGVEGWPTLYLIDHNGVIISEADRSTLDEDVEKAVKAAEAAKDKK